MLDKLKDRLLICAAHLKVVGEDLLAPCFLKVNDDSDNRNEYPLQTCCEPHVMSSYLCDNPEMMLTRRTKIYLIALFASGYVATTYSFCSQDKAAKNEKVELLWVFIILLNYAGEILIIGAKIL